MLRPLFALGLAAAAALSLSARPLVIAHRGASGYLPEHTLEAAAYAYAAGADYIEQDLILSRDGVLVVSHDIHIDTTTDVAARFPARKRADGRYYAIDFTWDELRTLKVNERVDAQTGRPVFPARFPSRADDGAGFRLCRFEEQVALIAGLNRSTGRRVGLYPELKEPSWHRREGRDPGAALLASLAQHGFSGIDDPVFIQCFEPDELKRLKRELHSPFKQIQLIGDVREETNGVDYAAIITPAGLREVASYAVGIGPHLGLIASGVTPEGKPKFTSLVADAHAAGLLVHPYTFRADTLPPGVPEFELLLEIFLRHAGIDGGFFDQPDLAVRFLERPR